MVKIKKILSAFVILIGIFTLNTIKVNAATGTATITVNKTQIVVGNEVKFTVTIKAPKNEKLGSYAYDLSYNKDYLTLQTSKSSDLSGAPAFTAASNIIFAAAIVEFLALGCGLIIIPFLVLISQIINI